MWLKICLENWLNWSWRVRIFRGKHNIIEILILNIEHSLWKFCRSREKTKIRFKHHLEADPDEVPEHSKDHDDHIFTLYAGDEDELRVEGQEYTETYAIYDENEIDEYWK